MCFPGVGFFFFLNKSSNRFTSRSKLFILNLNAFEKFLSSNLQTTGKVMGINCYKVL